MPLGLLREKHCRFPWGRTQEPVSRPHLVRVGSGNRKDGVGFHLEETDTPGFWKEAKC